ncbi:MAG: DUF11 domain-containing protein, partial [bacterium]|nr:DUF11 domain-containing protein [bacterium]
PVLSAEKVDVLFDDADGDGVASPGDVLLYQLTVHNDGNTAATAVVLSDQIPANTVLEAGSVQTSQGTVSSVDPIEIALGQVNVGVTATVSFQVRIDDPFPTDALAVSNQAVASSVELADVASDDPDAPGDADPTATQVFVTPEISIDDVAVTEGDPGDTVEAVFTVSLSEASNRGVTAGYQTGAGTAGADLDYASASGSVTFAPGETSRALSVTILGDQLDEPDETFNVTLSDIEGGVLTDGEGSGLILDDDPQPLVQVTGATVTEGDSGSIDAIFTVALSAPSSFDVWVDYLTADGSATAGLDYQAQAGTVQVPAGGLIATIAVPVLGDLIDEPDETFNVQLTSATNAVLATAVAAGTILDDDDPPMLSVTDVTVTEAPGAELVFTVALSAASEFDVTVDYQTDDATAIAGLDYTAVAGTLSLPAGTTSATVAVPVLDDALDEHDETLLLSLANAVKAQLPAAPAVGTIVDDDPLPALSIDDVTVTEGDSGVTDATFTVSLAASSGREVTVDFATAAGTAEAGADYSSVAGTLSFAPGETSQTITVDVLTD